MSKLATNTKLNPILFMLTFLLSVLALFAQLYYSFILPLNNQQVLFLLVFGFITVVILFPYKLSKKFEFSAFYLVSTFTLIVAWRLSGLAQMNIVVYLYLFAMVLKLFSFLLLGFQDIQKTKQANLSAVAPYHLSRFEWQALFVRMLIGFILVPHFCEKLFAGAGMRMLGVKDFAMLGVPHPELFVIVAGLCELAGAFAIGCGFMTRLGSIGLSLYLVVATLLGGHQYNSFIWASVGGGWEYPFLWACLIVSFVFFGAGHFSLDYVLKRRFNVPMWLAFLMGGPKINKPK